MSNEMDLLDRMQREAARLPAPRFTLDEVMRKGSRRRSRARIFSGLAVAATATLTVAVLVFATGGEQTVGSDDPSFIRAELGPEPLLEMAVLGTEIRLLDFDPPAEDLERIRLDVTIAPGNPIVVIGQVEGTSARVYRAFGYLEPGVNPAGDLWEHEGDAWCEWVFHDEGVIGPSCLPGILGVSEQSIASAADVAGFFVWVGLPGEVAFVAVRGNGVVSWQRPRGGVAAVPSETAREDVRWFDPYGVPLEIGLEFQREPMPEGAEPFIGEWPPTPELGLLADGQLGDLLYTLPAGDRSVFVLVRSVIGTDGRLKQEPPLLFATSCNVAQTVPLPRRWKGACLERIVDGELVSGPFHYGRDRPFGGWTDDGWSVGNIPDATRTDRSSELLNAVAPFDHESYLDSIVLGDRLVRVLNQQVFDCLAEAGFTPPEMGPMLDRDNLDRAVWFSPAFPDVEALGRDGFPDWSTDLSIDDFTEPSAEESAAARRCFDEVHGADSAATQARAVWVGVFGAWQQVLEEIEATDEIQSLVEEFGACLRAEGIPEESATWDRFLGYAQSLLMAAADDSAFLDSNARMGKLFAECGRELFEARDRLRGGERRTAFLTEHEESIRQLSTLLYGDG